MSLHYVVLLLGSNLGNPKKNILEAIAKIEKTLGKIEKTSEMLETEPVEFVSNNIFCNIALSLQTHDSPILILEKIKKIEREMGRTEDSFIVGEYIDRIIDIDLVMFNQLNFYSKRLKVPHEKHLFQRDFSKKLLVHLLS